MPLPRFAFAVLLGAGLSGLAPIGTAGRAAAFEALDGRFTATVSCPAYQSKNTRSNPGAIATEVDQTYRALGLNRASGDYVQIVVPGAPVTDRRWVLVECGTLQTGSGRQDAAVYENSNGDDSGRGGPESRDNVLAVSWQPAFCESRRSRRECAALNRDARHPAATRLSIHGLWPQPYGRFYCDVPPARIEQAKNGRWSALPALPLSAQTRAALDTAMPGSASHLDRYQWTKHGTCFGGAGGAEEYFRDTLHLLVQLNASAVRAFLADNSGRYVSAADLRDVFDSAFGPGAGARVDIDCSDAGDRRLIMELRIHLRGRITPKANLGDLMRAARPVGSGCRGGEIDAAG